MTHPGDRAHPGHLPEPRGYAQHPRPVRTPHYPEEAPMPSSPPRVSPRDRQAAVLGWTRIEKACAACGQRTPAACIDGHGQCPACARDTTQHEAEEQT
jgi:hypothetical protein